MLVILTLGLAALAAAAPVAQQIAGSSSSKGFFLVAKVTDPSKDLSPSINNWAFSTLHTGAGENAAALASPPAAGKAPGRIFYQNGTVGESKSLMVITDGGLPPAPYGITIQGPTQYDTTYTSEHVLFVNVGPGSPASVAGPPSQLPILVNGQGGGTFLGCNHTVAYYPGLTYITVEYAYAGEPLPLNCAPIVLVAQCTALNDLPAGSYSDHEFAAEVPCLQNVSAIAWK